MFVQIGYGDEHVFLGKSIYIRNENLFGSILSGIVFSMACLKTAKGK
jgi:hypothetical protein